MNEMLVLVDIFDNAIGVCDKEACHRQGLLHRAFSVFLYTGDRLLIQQRAAGKYHSGGLWTNSCCSHPMEGETLRDAVRRRLREEMGLDCACEELFSFVYHHRFGPDLYEYEFDHVWAGKYQGDIFLNPEEAADARWISFAELAEELVRRPEAYTVWFLTAAPKVLAALMERNDG